MKSKIQMSESVMLGIVLALAGGYMDAYSYICRDHVFANAQTGNILLLGVNLSEGKWVTALHYLYPVLAFVVGIALADMVKIKFKHLSVLHWRQIAVLGEAVILLGVCFIPQDMNFLANILTSLACGIQVESFRKIRGHSIATTMCIGNLRSGTQYMCDYIVTKETEVLDRAFLYYGIIVCFILGAILGNVFIKILGEKSILVCAGILFIGFAIMFLEKDKKQLEAIIV